MLDSSIRMFTFDFLLHTPFFKYLGHFESKNKSHGHVQHYHDHGFHYIYGILFKKGLKFASPPFMSESGIGISLIDDL